MPANIGEMFYTGEVPWHGKGLRLAHPATVNEAVRAAGLDWRVETVDLMTADDRPSPVGNRRKALVRADRPPGHEGRVVGVAHRGFQPVQNTDAALLFDAIFGHGESVYETGGYLGCGEVIWLLSRIDKQMEIGREDIVKPFALLANSHDGSMAFNISLTTIRVVCRNTLQLALNKQETGQVFRRAHQGSFRDHAEAAQAFFKSTIQELDEVADRFTDLSKKRCSDLQLKNLLEALLPEPKKPTNTEGNPGLQKAWEQRVEATKEARTRIMELRQSGQGAQLQSADGTFWGVLNAVLECVDHHQDTKSSRLAYALLGDGVRLKSKAFKLVQEFANAA